MEAAAERKRGRTVELNHSTRRQMRLSPDPPLVGWGVGGVVRGFLWTLVGALRGSTAPAVEENIQTERREASGAFPYAAASPCMVMGLHPPWLLNIYLRWRARARECAWECVCACVCWGSVLLQWHLKRDGRRGEESEQRPAFLHTFQSQHRAAFKVLREKTASRSRFLLKYTLDTVSVLRVSL